MQYSKFSNLNSEKGQALLIVVLIMIISLTIGLSVVSRSITNLRTSTDEASSQKAFSAAEAGIEQALKLNFTGESIVPSPISEGVNIKEIKVRSLSGAEISLNSGNKILQDDGADIWLVEHNSNGDIDYSSGWRELKDDQELTFYWGVNSANCPNEPALELIIITKDHQASGNIYSERKMFDPCDDRRALNQFTSVSSATTETVDGKTYAFKAAINIQADSGPKKNKAVLVRVVPLYADAVVGAKVTLPCIGKNSKEDDCNFPSQGKIIESTGQAGGTARKITYYQGYKKLPNEFFQYVLFSN